MHVGTFYIIGVNIACWRYGLKISVLSCLEHFDHTNSRGASGADVGIGS
jgi:hypothetical protein